MKNKKEKIPLFKVFMPNEVVGGLKQTLFSGYLSEGSKVQAFQKEVSLFLNNNNVVLTNSCTTALAIAYRLSGLKPGTEVISTPLTSVCTNQPILALGARIVWGDCDPNTGMLSPISVDKLINEKTKAIVVLHKDGDLADLNSLIEIATKHNVKLIEDAAHTFGAKYDGEKIGVHGDFVCFSFQAIKHITTGDGGALACKSIEDFKKAQKMKWLGVNKFEHPEINPWTLDITDWGYKGNMNDITATIGLAQIKHIDNIIDKYLKNGRLYNNLLENVDGITIIPRCKKNKPIYWTYCLLAENRDGLIKKLNKHGIEAGLVHPRNDQYTIFKDSRRSLPGVDYFSAREVNLPCGWWVGTKDINRIVDLIKAGW